MENKAASPKGLGRRRSMVQPSFSKRESKRNLLTRRASTGNMPSNTRNVLDIPDKHRAILKKGIGHIRLSIEGSAFHKWLEYLAHVKFGDLTKKSRFILQSKYNEKDCMSTKDYETLQEWVLQLCWNSLGKLSKKSVRAILSESKYREYSDGEPIFYQSQHGSYYMLLLSGQVDIMLTENHQRAIETHSFYDHHSWRDYDPKSRMGKIVAQIHAGNGFGGIALMSKRPKRSASAIASMSSEILLVPKNTYLAHLAQLHKAEATIDRRVAFLKQESYFFKKWKHNRLVNLAYGIVEEEYSRGSTIEKQGDDVRELRLLVNGEVSVYETRNGEKHCVALKNKGTFFGQMEFVKGKKQQVTIIAHTNCLVYKIPRAVYDRLVSKSNPDGSETRYRLSNITHMYEERHHKAMKRIQQTRNKDKPLFQISASPKLPKVTAKGKIEAEWSDYTAPKDKSLLTFDLLDDAVKRDSMGFPPRSVPPPTRIQPPWASGEILGYNCTKKSSKQSRNMKKAKVNKNKSTRGKSHEHQVLTVRQFKPPPILAKTLELMETKFSQNNPAIRNAMQRK